MSEPIHFIKSELAKQKDEYTYEILDLCLNKYINDLNFNDKINALLSKKKRRNENFPSDISENIVKFAFAKKYRIMPCWDTQKGDLIIYKFNLFTQIEVKGFTSEGPSSFGPTEEWDWIYFVDGTDIRNKNFKVYEIHLSNKSKVFQSIVLSGKHFSGENIPPLPNDIDKLTVKQLKELCKNRGLIQKGRKEDMINRLKTDQPGSKFKKPKTYGEICKENKRGELRSSFDDTFKPQLGEHCKLIFDGNISDLNNTL
jgi:hypothetical protein